MAKNKTIYVCQNCGSTQPRWLGRCPSCEQWNTLVEERVIPKSKSGAGQRAKKVEPSLLSELPLETSPRIISDLQEMDRALGGGFVLASSVLFGGDPGVGKSTLLLQTASILAQKGFGVFYITAEESAGQIRFRSERLKLPNLDFQVSGDGDLETGLEWANQLNPKLVIVDSIQTCRSDQLDSPPGSVAQVREVASRWTDWAKSTGNVVALVGHVTKEGAIAGPRVVEHLVDTVLLFEGDQLGGVRILRTLKNRFGATGELGVFEMGEAGLMGVKDPSSLFLSKRGGDDSGVAVASTIRGTRPLLIEIQALVSRSFFASPQRNATGFDPRRLSMLIAVLEKKVGVNLSGQDIFINATGGLRLEDSGSDLAAAVAIYSSLMDKPLDSGTALIGEVGLTGEVRTVQHLDRRLAEVAHLSFKRAIIPNAGRKPPKFENLKIIQVKSLEEAIDFLGEGFDQ
ncbi:DNA repair protein RadA [bacterium]|nr:DNA repair protein RadA [bacterium]